jgi:hypothetical protein
MAEAKDKKPFDINDYLGQVAELQTKHTVEAALQQQFGIEHLRFRCPMCNLTGRVDREGKYLCLCGTPLTIRRKG